MVSQASLNSMRVRLRQRARTVRQQQSGMTGTDNNPLLRELQRSLLASTDFKQVIDQIEQRLARSLTQQLVTQPLQQLGGDLGGGVRDALFGDAFAPSATQTGALLSRLLDSAESIL